MKLSVKTKLKEAENKIARSKHDWEDTFDAIPEIITVHDRDFNIIRANKAAREILNLPLLKADLNAKCFKYYHGAECPPEDCPSCASRKTGMPAVFEMYEPHLNMFLEIMAIPRMDSNNNFLGVIHVGRDITEKKKLEAQLLHSHKMEAIGILAGGVAHDFNNILTAITGYGHLMKMKTKEGDPLRVYADQIIASSERAANLTQSLLAFSRKQIINPKPVELNYALRKVENLLQRIIGEEIELRTILADRDITVVADINQIEQVIMNLAANARDAMPKGGVLEIKSDVTEIGEEFIREYGYGEQGTYAFISVTDTGTGMDEKTRERIFEPFFTTKEVGKGTGLGLSMAYGIIKQHNGYINCDSEATKGTTFRIYLPLIKSKAEKTKPAAAFTFTAGTETILLAEDEISVRKLMKEVLEEFGYKVIEAEDGEDAVIKFKENKDNIHLLLFDVVMPKMNGKEAHEKIREIKPDIKALFVSGYAAEIIHKNGILEEGTNFMFKPVSPEDILKNVREAIDR